jgi:hypothetical protein
VHEIPLNATWTGKNKSRTSRKMMRVKRALWSRDTPIWNLEAPLKCRSCKKGRYRRQRIRPG